MSNRNAISDKKIELLACKAKLIEDIKYYEKRIKEFPADENTKAFYGASYSSDSEDDFPTHIDNTPSVPQLKLQQALLRTCLQATQELTSLQVLQSGVNLMVQEPELNGETAVTEPGCWREVIAECRIDLVPFSIMFYVHEPPRAFGTKSFRCLKVLPGKSSHEAELATSILSQVTRPSDAVEILRSYATAYRSRRSTLARLADKYAQNLHMEPLEEGGYLLKCADLLKLSWRLENKSSPVADFHHRMKFELEYMAESYIRTITQAHKQLSNPAISTDERTLLLARIITTCLEAQGPTKELYESMESDPESVKKLTKRRTTLDQEEPEVKKKREGAADGEIMAPPKALPKKGRPKSNDNAGDNRKSVKRSHGDELSVSKRAKIGENLTRNDKMTNRGDDNSKCDDKFNKNDVFDENVFVDDNKAKSGVSQRVVDKKSNNAEVKDGNANKTNSSGKKVQNYDKNLQENSSKLKEKIVQRTSKEIETNVMGKEKTVSSKLPKAGVTAKISKEQNFYRNDVEKDKDIGKTNEQVLASSKNYQATKANSKIVNQIANNPKTKETVGKNVKNKDGSTKNGPNVETIKPTSKTNTEQNKTDKLAKKNKEIENNENNKNSKPKNLYENERNTKKSNENEKMKEKDGAKEIAKSKSASNDNNKKSKTNLAAKVINKENINLNSNVKPKIAEKPETKKVSKNNEQNSKNSNDKVKNKQNEPKSVNKVKSVDQHLDKAKTNISEPQKNTETSKLTKTATEISKNDVKEPKKYLNLRSSFPKEDNKKITVEKAVKVNNVATKNKDYIADRQIKDLAKKYGEKSTKSDNKLAIKNLSHKNTTAQSKLRSSIGITGETTKTGNIKTGKENGGKFSKIPQKLTAISETQMNRFRNHLRISPRKLLSSTKSSSDFNKPVTNIPRLMKKAK